MADYLRSEAGGIHISYNNIETEECIKNGYTLIPDYVKYRADLLKSKNSPAKEEKMVEVIEIPVKLETRVEPQKRSPGRPKIK